jgi:hypothetical protein
VKSRKQMNVLVIRWTIIAAVILSVAIFVVPMFVPWNPINCRHEDVDITSGRMRYTRYLLFCKVSERIEDSPLTKVLALERSATRPPDWRRVNTFSPGVHHSPHYAFHSASFQILNLAGIWEMAGGDWFTEEMRRKTALDILALWQHSGSDSMASDYIRCLSDLTGDTKPERLLAELTKVRMPLIETNGAELAQTVFFPNGQPMDRVCGYVDKSGNFVRHGIWECWAADGTRILYGHFENGEHHGRRFEWDRHGKLCSIIAYNHGELIEFQHENLENHPDFKTAQELGAHGDLPRPR